MTIPLPGPDADPTRPIASPDVNRARGHHALRLWSVVGLAGVLGLTAVSAGLAYDTTRAQQEVRARIIEAASSADRQRSAAEAANLSAVRRQSQVLARTLARDRTILAQRRRARAAAIAALAVAEAQARAATAAPSSVAVPSTPASSVVAAPRPVVRTDDGGDGAAAASGGS